MMYQALYQSLQVWKKKKKHLSDLDEEIAWATSWLAAPWNAELNLDNSFFSKGIKVHL